MFTNYGSDGSTANEDRHYNRFSCAVRLINRNWIEEPWADVPGSCSASRAYAWGFSFHFVFIISILSASVAVTLYSMWLDAQRLALKRVDTGTFLDAALLISRAQQEFGADSHEWKANRVDKVILKGGQGMGHPPAYLRLRNLR